MDCSEETRELSDRKRKRNSQLMLQFLFSPHTGLSPASSSSNDTARVDVHTSGKEAKRSIKSVFVFGIIQRP